MGRGIYCASSLINATLAGSHHHTQQRREAGALSHKNKHTDAQDHYWVHQQLSGHGVKPLRLVVLHQHQGEDQASF